MRHSLPPFFFPPSLAQFRESPARFRRPAQRRSRKERIILDPENRQGETVSSALQNNHSSIPKIADVMSRGSPNWIGDGIRLKLQFHPIEAHFDSDSREEAALWRKLFELVELFDLTSAGRLVAVLLFTKLHGAQSAGRGGLQLQSVVGSMVVQWHMGNSHNRPTTLHCIHKRDARGIFLPVLRDALPSIDDHADR